MENKLQVILKDSGLEKSKAQYILDAFHDIFEITAEWERRAKRIKVTDSSQIDMMQKAKEGREVLSAKRIEIEKTRKLLKEHPLREGQTIDGIAKTLQGVIAPIETHLKEQEDFVKNQIKAREEERRIKVEEKAEKERIKKEKAEAKERERIQKENEKLRKENEAKDKKIREEREENERKQQEKDNAHRKEREEAEAKAQKVKDDAVRAEREKTEKVQAELKAKEEEEEKARKEAEEEEEARKGASDKVKLQQFAKDVSNVVIPDVKSKEATVIIERMNKAFNWLYSQAV